MLLAAAPPDRPLFMLLGILKSPKILSFGFHGLEGRMRRIQLQKVGGISTALGATTVHSHYTPNSENLVTSVAYLK